MFHNTLKEKLSKIKTDTQQKANHLIETVRIDEPTRNERYNICLSCEHLFKPTNNCKKCGCFMTAKTWLKHASCPIKKW